MERYFGTDGIRGLVGEELTAELAFRCGNALAREKTRPKILLGRDTRRSGEMLSLAFAAGVTEAGGDVLDAQVLPTPAIAALTKEVRADFGVVISASHNPPEYNGIKIFNREGQKLSREEESALEARFSSTMRVSEREMGRFWVYEKAAKEYEKLITSNVQDLSKLTVVLDCANGAASTIAPRVFEQLGARVFAISCAKDGEINVDCGAVAPKRLAKEVVRLGADVGFAFDGDADRLIAVDETGRIRDGDALLYLLARDLLKRGELAPCAVVGTAHSNEGLAVALQELDVSFLRTDVGDKFVAERMRKDGIVLGGEPSGHVILGTRSTTGDGILVALAISSILVRTGKPFSALAELKLFPQVNVSVAVQEKVRILGNERLAEVVRAERERLAGGRILVRASGTEPKVRVMAESDDVEKSAASVERIVAVLLDLEENGG